MRTYQWASSVRLVLRECEFESREADSFVKEPLLWQEVAHHRFSYCGNSHIFAHCFAPAPCSQWQ